MFRKFKFWKERGNKMSRKESQSALEKSSQPTTVNLAEQATRVVEETAKTCANGHRVTIQYLGQSVEALELDLRKFIFKIAEYMTFN